MNRIAHTVLVNTLVGTSIAAQLLALALFKAMQPFGLIPAAARVA